MRDLFLPKAMLLEEVEAGAGREGTAPVSACVQGEKLGYSCSAFKTGGGVWWKRDRQAARGVLNAGPGVAVPGRPASGNGDQAWHRNTGWRCGSSGRVSPNSRRQVVSAGIVK